MMGNVVHTNASSIGELIVIFLFFIANSADWDDDVDDNRISVDEFSEP